MWRCYGQLSDVQVTNRSKTSRSFLSQLRELAFAVSLSLYSLLSVSAFVFGRSLIFMSFLNNVSGLRSVLLKLTFVLQLL